jgi:cytochrome c oxidase cbb3-type subunit 3
MKRPRRVVFTVALVLTLAACKREERPQPSPPPPSGNTVLQGLRLGQLQPGQSLPVANPPNPYEENAFAVSQGKRLFRQYNCNGCHAQGGGDSGPALMDDKWIYGSAPANIFATIVQGRPNGMPSFGGHVPEQQIWQIVAYIRSMSGQLRTDVAPSRSDSLQDAPPEQRRDKEQLKQGGNLPKAAEH